MSDEGSIVVVNYFNDAQVAQREGHWRDALALVEEGYLQKCGMCTWWLADIYREGYWGKRRDMKMFDRLLKEARSQKNPRAFVTNYWNGPDVWLEYRLDRDNDPYALGVSYVYGYFGVGRNYEMGKYYLNQCQDSFAKQHLVHACVTKTEEMKARREAAREGNPANQFLLARALISPNAIRERLYWYRCAADQDYFDAQKELYEYFMTTCYNPAAGRYWHNRAKQLDSCGYLEYHVMNQEQIFDAIEKCQRACLQLILIRKYRQSILNAVDKGVVLMIAKKLWETCEEDCWKVRKSDRLRRKKRIKYF